MKKFILNLICIIPLLSFPFSEKDLIHYLTQHPDCKITCYPNENIYFLQNFSCYLLYRNNFYYIYFFNHYLAHNNLSKIKFINTGTSDKPNLEIIDQDPFYDKFSNTDKHFFYPNSRILFYDTGQNVIYISIRYNRGVNQLLDNDYHTTFYFSTAGIAYTRSYLKKIFISNSLQFNTLLDSTRISDQIPTLTLDKIKSIYRIAFKEQKCFKSIFGCVYKTITLLDTIAIQNPHIPSPLVMRAMHIYHDIEDFPSVIRIESNNEKVKDLIQQHSKFWNFHQVLIYRASDDEKIYVLDPYFLEDGVIEYNRWISEYLKATNSFIVELYQRLD